MFSASQLLVDHFDNSLFGSIMNVFKTIGGFTSILSTNLQYVFFISLAIFVTGIVLCCVMIARTYESRLLRSVTGFNRYFKKNPFINEDNLVEVNNRFKQVPKTLRYWWQAQKNRW